MTKPATWAKRLPCPCGADRNALAMMNYDGWFRVECHAGRGCDNFGPSGFRKDAVEMWNECVRDDLAKAKVGNSSPQADGMQRSMGEKP